MNYSCWTGSGWVWSDRQTDLGHEQLRKPVHHSQLHTDENNPETAEQQYQRAENLVTKKAVCTKSIWCSTSRWKTFQANSTLPSAPIHPHLDPAVSTIFNCDVTYAHASLLTHDRCSQVATSEHK